MRANGIFFVILCLLSSACGRNYTKQSKDLDSADSRVRADAARTLGGWYLSLNDAQDRPPDEILVQRLTRLLYDPDTNVRASAAQGLAFLGPRAKKAVPSLIELVKKNDDAIVDAIITLGSIGPAATESVPHLLESIQKNRRAKSVGLQSLGLMAPEDKRTLKALEKGLEEEDALVRTTAAATLGYIGPPAASAIPALKKAANDDDPYVANAAKNAIQRIEQR